MRRTLLCVGGPLHQRRLHDWGPRVSVHSLVTNEARAGRLSREAARALYRHCQQHGPHGRYVQGQSVTVRIQRDLLHREIARQEIAVDVFIWDGGA